MSGPEKRRRTRLGTALGLSCCAVGGFLLIWWILLRISPELLQAARPVPFFDQFVRWNHTPLVVAHAAVSILLFATGLGILRSRWFAPAMFTVVGWGTFVLTTLAIIPGDDMKFRMQTAVNVSSKYQGTSSDAGFLELVPENILYSVGAAIAVVAVMLIVGSLHLWKNRNVYKH